MSPLNSENPVKSTSQVEPLEHNEEESSIRRQVGDGESLPNTPPNETVELPSTKVVKSGKSPFAFQVTVDFMAVILFIVGLATRVYRLDQPRNVVFDEMHYGKYASLYLKKTFFFDANPPLGKLLIALAGYFYGYDGGSFGFDKIGTPYPEDVPHAIFRLVPAVFGSLLSPSVFLILCELNVTVYAGYLACFMIVFGKFTTPLFEISRMHLYLQLILIFLDTALLTQSRFVLLESMMIFFALMSVLSALKMRRYYEKPLGLGWTFWLMAAAINIGLAFSVKYLAFYSCCLCIAILLK